ncbi:hypothetical protein BJY04DRAFT_222436 [Aspergillus karnatakaensis]|uniref:uncharacterized protein n=1 Tax=Aspergillus karnatakaensis TaxID=1810916 RepID=UPI003CCD9DA8
MSHQSEICFLCNEPGERCPHSEAVFRGQSISDFSFMRSQDVDISPPPSPPPPHPHPQPPSPPAPPASASRTSYPIKKGSKNTQPLDKKPPKSDSGWTLFPNPNTRRSEPAPNLPVPSILDILEASTHEAHLAAANRSGGAYPFRPVQIFSCSAEGCDNNNGNGWHNIDVFEHHQQTAHEWTKVYPCPITSCEEVFTSSNECNRHRDQKHEVVRMCRYVGCKRSFANKDEQIRHETNDHFDVERAFRN